MAVDDAAHSSNRDERVALRGQQGQTGLQLDHAAAARDLLDGATDDEAALVEMMQLAQAAVRALKRGLRPDGVNIGMNIGRAAGAGAPRPGEGRKA